MPFWQFQKSVTEQIDYTKVSCICHQWRILVGVIMERFMNQQAKEKIISFIQKHPLVVVGTVDANNQPYGAAVYVGVDAYLNLYFLTKSETDKNKNILETPYVSVAVADEASQTTLKLRGEASRLATPEEHEQALSALGTVNHKSGDWLPPLPKIQAGYYLVYKITPSCANLSTYSNRHLEEGPVSVEFQA